MSAQVPNTPPEVRRVKFTQPSALNVEVVGADGQTGETFILVGAPGNMIIRAIMAPASGLTYDLIIKRDGKEVRRVPSDLLLSSQQGPIFPGFPIGIRPGQIQFAVEQTAGSPGAINADIVFARSLVTVIS